MSDAVESKVKKAMDIEAWPEGVPSQEILWDMRRNGLPKPVGVPDTLWWNVQKISHNHENIVDLLMSGHTKKEISEKLGLTPNNVYLVTREPTFKAYYAERRKAREHAINRDGIHDLFDVAIDVAGEILQAEGEKAATRLDAAKFIIEQSVGKSKQEVKVESHLLAEVISRVEELKSRHVSELPEFLVKSRDKFDDFIDALDTPQISSKDLTNGEESESKP